ncbi:MAG: site-specific integrase [Candidatus Omnitrophota bacterium]
MDELEKVINGFLFHCRVEKNLSGHTLKAYKLDLGQFTAYLFRKKEVIRITLELSLNSLGSFVF